ncbi:hypothetical protein CRH09_31095 [Nocardia terpenica]|uniref:Uncharacterized protein n=1 Tax=Nocardia terpenica TaxID=455432 RepID=A0A291RRT6_9NOCA|nr:hypothetical protein CRH09_31095 [Nocardia terpenica]
MSGDPFVDVGFVEEQRGILGAAGLPCPVVEFVAFDAKVADTVRAMPGSRRDLVNSENSPPDAIRSSLCMFHRSGPLS